MNHKCKEKERIEELKSAVGQSAYAYYSLWMKLKKRSVPPIETFSASSLYTTFIKFATWAKRTRLPNVPNFIKTMVANGDVQPALWCRDNVYAMYVQNYDGIVTPTQQFVTSIEEVMTLASEFKCTPEDVFRRIGVDSLLDMVHKRKISPWFLVASRAFRNWWQTLSPDDASRVEDTIQVGALMIRITRSEQLKTILAEFSAATQELGL